MTEDLPETPQDKKGKTAQQETEDWRIKDTFIRLFREDLQHLEKIFETGNIPNHLYEGKPSLFFNGMMYANPADPAGTPRLIIRPSDVSALGDKYPTDRYVPIGHRDILRCWKSMAKGDADRKLVLDTIAHEVPEGSSGERGSMIEVYFYLVKDGDKTRVVFSSGWSGYEWHVAEQLYGKGVMELNQQQHNLIMASLREYGIDEIVVGDESVVLSERSVLEVMLGPIIEERATKLAQIATPRNVEAYKNLARRFLLDPHPNKNTPLYYKYLEYEEMLKKIN